MLAGALAAPAQSQPGERKRRIGILVYSAEGDPDTLALIDAFRQGLEALGWTPDRNLAVEHRWGRADPALIRSHARELVASSPDVLLTHSIQLVTALRDATKTIPIVFANASDPVEAGLVASYARPGGNITGFTSIAAATNVKWLELIKEIGPQTSRVGVLISAQDPSNNGRFRAIEAAGPALQLAVTSLDVATPSGIESAIEAFAREPGGALIVVPNAVNTTFRQTTIRAAAQHRLPAIYPFRQYAVDGGLLAYGQNRTGQFRSAAGYVDRILKGEKPGDLPIQAPTSFEMVINLKTAKALGLAIPPTLIARADEVIE